MNDDRFAALVARHLDRTLDADGRSELAATLRADHARRREYLRLLEQEELIAAGVREVLTPSARIEAARLPPPTRRVRRRARIRRWTAWGAWVAAAAVLVTVGAVLLRADGAAPFRAAAEGAVVVERAGARLPAAEGLRHGDVLSAVSGGILRFPDGGTVSLAPEARVRLRADAAAVQGVRLGLERGTIACALPSQPRGFTVETPQAQVAVVGTRFRVAAAAEASRVEVEEGRVQVGSTAGRVLLSAGEQAHITVAGIVRSVADVPARLDDPQRWIAGGTLAAEVSPGGAVLQAQPARGTPRLGWSGRAWRWHAPLPATAAVAVQARFTLPRADDGVWHGEVFLAPPDAHQDADEAQPSPCLRLAVRTGIPMVARRTTPDEEKEPLWTGDALPAGAHLLRLEVRGREVTALIDGRPVWRGALPFPTFVPGVRWTRRSPGSTPAHLDQVALESLLPP